MILVYFPRSSSETMLVRLTQMHIFKHGMMMQDLCFFYAKSVYRRSFWPGWCLLCDSPTLKSRLEKHAWTMISLHLRHFTAAAKAGVDDSTSNPIPTDIKQIWSCLHLFSTVPATFQEGMTAPPPGLGSRPLRFGTDCSGAEVGHHRSTLLLGHGFCIVWSSQAPWFALKAISSELVWASMSLA